MIPNSFACFRTSASGIEVSPGLPVPETAAHSAERPREAVEVRQIDPAAGVLPAWEVAGAVAVAVPAGAAAADVGGK